ncbi:hypothetical protein F5Y14DRAFT_437661 [Nemania sp. NC0429]|nr:hypothetical protein F5Y14DRAFT_437661 [Nemania sp. NC0429]
MIDAIFVLFFLLHLAASESATLTQAPAYASQRPCAQGCFAFNLYKGPDRLAQGIGCDYKNPQNECICRPDLQSDGDSFLQECVDNACSQNTLDTNSAISIYDNYCANAGFLRSTPTTSESSTTSSSSSQSHPQSTTPQTTPHTTQTSSLTSSNSASVEDSNSRKGPGQTQGPAPSETGAASSGSGSGGNNGLDTGSIVGIVVGVLGFIATAIGTWFTYKSIRNKRAQPPPYYQPHVERGWRY